MEEQEAGQNYCAIRKTAEFFARMTATSRIKVNSSHSPGRSDRALRR
jgi:hypothetical protein